MNIISVDASVNYDVYVGQDLLQSAGSMISQIVKPSKAAIISDDTVFPLYGQAVTDSLQTAGFDVVSYVFPAGESSKNGSNYLNILNFLAEEGIARSDVLIALGGGVVGDITGFAAATFLRGIAYVQIPTTLLAMVDSSIGGKTAIDLTAGKNLAGAFYQPRLVLCDLNTLISLPKTVFCDGCAEVIKYAVLFDDALFQHLFTYGLDFSRESVISRCIELKRDIVKQDEFDNGVRQLLNLGHTIGHAIEAESSFTISHGKAVAMGMALISKIAVQQTLCSATVYTQICEILEKFALPTQTDYSADMLYQRILSDKKRTGDTINLIIPERIGHCTIRKTRAADIKTIIKAGF